MARPLLRGVRVPRRLRGRACEGPCDRRTGLLRRVRLASGGPRRHRRALRLPRHRAVVRARRADRRHDHTDHRRAIQHRRRVVRAHARPWGDGSSSPERAPVTIEAIAGGIFELCLHHELRGEIEELPQMLPSATYVALAPFVGSEDAGLVATEQSLDGTASSDGNRTQPPAKKRRFGRGRRPIAAGTCLWRRGRSASSATLHGHRAPQLGLRGGVVGGAPTPPPLGAAGGAERPASLHGRATTRQPAPR